MNLSFSKTIAPILFQAKRVTRRRWTQRTLTMWQRAFAKDPDAIHTGWTRSPCYGGQRLCQFRLQAAPYLDYLYNLTPADCVAEGFPHLTPEQFIRDVLECQPTDLLAVVWFQVLGTYSLNEDSRNPFVNLCAQRKSLCDTIEVAAMLAGLDADWPTQPMLTARDVLDAFDREHPEVWSVQAAALAAKVPA